jgi:hypothetical protein
MRYVDSSILRSWKHSLTCPKHEVVSHGEVRFALTSRKIIPEKLKTEEEREYAISAGEIPASFPYTYDGSITI